MPFLQFVAEEEEPADDEEHLAFGGRVFAGGVDGDVGAAAGLCVVEAAGWGWGEMCGCDQWVSGGLVRESEDWLTLLMQNNAARHGHILRRVLLLVQHRPRERRRMYIDEAVQVRTD